MLRQLFRLPGSRSKSIETMVRQVAEASVDAVLHAVRGQIAEMGPFEARGYIRARAGVMVRRHARVAVSQQGDVTTPWETIAAHASDRVAPLVLRRLSEDARSTVRRRVA
jgi:hypothetical protein